MCRRNQLLGCALLAFGVGILLGTWLKGGLISCLLALLAIFWGVSVCRKK